MVQVNPAYLTEEKEKSIKNGVVPKRCKSKINGIEPHLNRALDYDSTTLNISNYDNYSTSTACSYKKEKWNTVLAQIIIPFFIAGFGMVAAGVLLDTVQNWELFLKVREVIVLVPALLGLKGNLEMTLASRLSTQVNLGRIHNKKTTKQAVLGNFAITQLQSIIVGFLASFVACVTELIIDQKFTPSNLLTIISSSVLTASLASLILGGIVMFIIILSKKLKINPDNIATPIASSLGDVVTLSILSGVGTFFYMFNDLFYIHIGFILLFIILMPLFAYFSYHNEFVKETLIKGWVPIIIAMLISSVAGIILDVAIKLFSTIAIYQPVVNGIGGNLVAIFASRLSTALHKKDVAGKWAEWAPHSWYNFPIDAFFARKNPEHKTGIILLLLAIPGHTIFFFTIYYILSADKRPNLTATLVIFYIIVSVLQVFILLVLCYWLVHFFWRLKKNPDLACIPLLTATGDLFGVTFLLLAFYLVFITGNTSVQDLYEKNSTDLLLTVTNATYHSLVT